MNFFISSSLHSYLYHVLISNSQKSLGFINSRLCMRYHQIINPSTLTSHPSPLTSHPSPHVCSARTRARAHTHLTIWKRRGVSYNMETKRCLAKARHLFVTILFTHTLQYGNEEVSRILRKRDTSSLPYYSHTPYNMENMETKRCLLQYGNEEVSRFLSPMTSISPISQSRMTSISQSPMCSVLPISDPQPCFSEAVLPISDPQPCFSAPNPSY